jgi:hypothetical protein
VKQSDSLPLRKRAAAALADIEAVHKMRDKLKLPSERLGVVEWYYQKPIGELSGGEAFFAQAVCVSFNDRALVDFSENYMGGRIAGIENGEGSAAIVLFNARLAEGLEGELENLRAWVQLAYDATGCTGSVEDSEPVATLRHRAYQARQAAASGTGGEHGLRSLLSGLD